MENSFNTTGNNNNVTEASDNNEYEEYNEIEYEGDKDNIFEQCYLDIDSSVYYWLHNEYDDDCANKNIVESIFRMLLYFIEDHELECKYYLHKFYKDFVNFVYKYSSHEPYNSTIKRTRHLLYSMIYLEDNEKQINRKKNESIEDEDMILFLDKYETYIGLLLDDMCSFCETCVARVLDKPRACKFEEYRKYRDKSNDFITLCKNNITIKEDKQLDENDSDYLNEIIEDEN
tara:strand:+ start:2678 stop:3370 length:693 start_codon:yes stop_codon:yes gene_type:complete